VGNLALTATLYEVSAAPKPGLVDPFSRGAHSDMDYFTFLASAAALAPFFVDFARIGAEFAGESPGLLAELRKLGIEAEKSMYAATQGINTHKGLIFSMGLACAAAGKLLVSDRRAEISDRSAVIIGMYNKRLPISLAESPFANLFRLWKQRCFSLPIR